MKYPYPTDPIVQAAIIRKTNEESLVEWAHKPNPPIPPLKKLNSGIWKDAPFHTIIHSIIA